MEKTRQTNSVNVAVRVGELPSQKIRRIYHIYTDPHLEEPEDPKSTIRIYNGFTTWYELEITCGVIVVFDLIPFLPKSGLQGHWELPVSSLDYILGHSTEAPLHELLDRCEILYEDSYTLSNL